MVIYIRADMNREIASGHVMRCLSVADAAAEMGVRTVFLTADEIPHELIRSRGYEARSLNTDWRDPEGELPALESFFREAEAGPVLVDHYKVTPRYLRELSRMRKTAYLDDLALFPYETDLVINYEIYAEDSFYPVKHPGTEFCLGPAYAPLRAEFAGVPAKKISGEPENILLVSGGTDPADILLRTATAIPRGRYQKLRIVCGKLYGKTEELRSALADRSEAEVLTFAPNLKDYMEEADILISAGGSTLYEACALGTPTITYALADNQLDNVKAFRDKGLMDYAGDTRYEDVPARICRILETYQDYDLRLSRSRNMQRLTDGRGAERIVAKLLERSDADKGHS